MTDELEFRLSMVLEFKYGGWRLGAREIPAAHALKVAEAIGPRAAVDVRNVIREQAHRAERQVVESIEHETRRRAEHEERLAGYRLDAEHKRRVQLGVAPGEPEGAPVAVCGHRPDPYAVEAGVQVGSQRFSDLLDGCTLDAGHQGDHEYGGVSDGC